MPKKPDSRSQMSEAQRYRVAAEQALEQLDWVIDYLHKIRKPRIANALRSNRTEIGRTLR
jgi:hypothetical protein